MNKCKIPHHDCQKIKYICVDRKCSFASKIGCADCFLEQHMPNHASNSQQHKRILINQFENELRQKVQALQSVQVPIITNDLQQFDFDDCLTKIMGRVNIFKEKLSEEVQTDIIDLQSNINQFNLVLQQSVGLQKPISELSEEELNQVIQLYENSESSAAELLNRAQKLEVQKHKIHQKKDKAVQKLKSAVDVFMRELENCDESNNIHGTPEKPTIQSRTTQICSGNSTTQSPPTKNLIEIARQKKQSKQQKN